VRPHLAWPPVSASDGCLQQKTGHGTGMVHDSQGTEIMGATQPDGIGTGAAAHFDIVVLGG
jgi:hypothetical protein